MSSSKGVRIGAVVLTAATATALAACGSGSSSGGSSSAPSDTVTIAFNADAAPNGYDPMLYSQGQYTFFAGLYDALFVTDKDGKVQPNLVDSFSSNADNTQLTLKLKRGVTFTDGSTLDSALVKQNLDRRSDKTLVAYGQLAPGGASEITGIATPDAQTVVITWAKPQAMGQNNLTDEAGVIVGKQGLANPASLKTTPDGSGPYTLDNGNTTRASTYTLVKNPKAWNGKAFAYKTVVFKVITDVQAQANALLSGQADIAPQLDEGTLAQVESRKSISKVGGTIVGFPVADKTGKSNPAFAKPEVRLALSYATDRATLVKTLHPGARATAQLFPKEAPGYDPALDSQYAYNPTKAKQLLAQAGYPNGFSIDLTVGGQPTEDEIAIQKQWAEVGVKLNFITATSTDAVFAAAATEPLLFGPFTVGNQPAGFVAGVLYNGFANLQHATDPNIEANLGKALGSTGAAQEAALKGLNDALTNDGWFIAAYEDYIYAGYDSAKVAKPAYAGTNNYLVLSDIKPAS